MRTEQSSVIFKCSLEFEKAILANAPRHGSKSALIRAAVSRYLATEGNDDAKYAARIQMRLDRIGLMMRTQNSVDLWRKYKMRGSESDLMLCEQIEKLLLETAEKIQDEEALKILNLAIREIQRGARNGMDKRTARAEQARERSPS